MENPVMNRTCLEKSFELFRENGDVKGVFLSWCGVVSAIEREFDDFSAFDRWIEALELILLNGSEFPSKEAEQLVVAGMLTALTLRQPNHPNIDRWIEHGLHIANTETSDVALIAKILSYITYYYIQIGNLQKADIVMSLLRHKVRTENIPSSERLAFTYTMSFYWQLKGCDKKCIEIVASGFKSCKSCENRKYCKHVLMKKAMFIQAINNAINTGAYGEGQVMLDELDGLLENGESGILSRYYFLRARLSLHQGEFGKAHSYIEIAVNYAIKFGAPFVLALCHLAKTCILNKIKKYEEAQECLGETFKLAALINSQLLLFYISFNWSTFAFDEGNKTFAFDCFKMALEIKRKCRYHCYYIGNPCFTTELFEMALKNNVESNSIRKIIQESNILPEGAALFLDNWPWKIKIFTLGRFTLFKDDTPLKTCKKAQKKPISMLKTLIALGGRDVPEGQISDILWPESDGDTAHKSFATTLHRLRKLLGYHDALNLSEGLLSLNPRYCWVDAWVFERAFGQADSEWQTFKKLNGKSAPTDLSLKVINIYRGAFLTEEKTASWAILFRERLQSKFTRAIQDLADHFQKKGALEDAIELYKRGLEVDGLVEVFYRRLILCYKRAGRHAEALYVYRRCKHIFLSIMGVKPSHETEKVIQALLAEEREKNIQRGPKYPAQP